MFNHQIIILFKRTKGMKIYLHVIKIIIIIRVRQGVFRKLILMKWFKCLRIAVSIKIYMMLAG